MQINIVLIKKYLAYNSHTINIGLNMKENSTWWRGCKDNNKSSYTLCSGGPTCIMLEVALISKPPAPFRLPCET